MEKKVGRHKQGKKLGRKEDNRLFITFAAKDKKKKSISAIRKELSFSTRFIDITSSVFIVIVVFVSVCPFVALLKANSHNTLHIVFCLVRIIFIKKIIFNILRILIYLCNCESQ